MKAASFAYDRAESKAEAIALLAEHGEEAKVLAGGQSLIPMMNLRLARPTRLIDIGYCEELARITREGSSLRCGAMVRHARFERAEDPELAECAAMSRASRYIGHAPIRSRGTIGGSLAHADSSSEWCLMMLALDGTMRLESVRGTRHVPADQFFQAFFTTALDYDELLTSIEFPASTRGTALVEHARRHGDFAIIAAATRIDVGERLRVRSARIALGGVAGHPLRMVEVEKVLHGLDVMDDRATREAVDEVAHMCAASVEVTDDAHASAEYRRRLTSTLVSRALFQSVQDWRATP